MMNKMRKMVTILTVLTVGVLLAGSLAACGSGNGQSAGNAQSGQSARNAQNAMGEQAGRGFQVVTTIFPEYDWVREILGQNPANAEVTMLLDNGVDLHSYQPTAADILKISTCDLFIYVGGESDEWVEDALQEAVNQDMIVINLLDVLGDAVKEEEVVEGMQGVGKGEEEEEEPEYDEHVWLSLKNAGVLCDAIEEALAKIDEANADTYQSNVEAYKAQLSALDTEYQSTVNAAAKKTILFGDRFPFRYLTDEYGLFYYAAFVGCSAETEASFETIVFLANKTDELGLSTILAIEGSDHRIAETIKNNTTMKDQQILSMNSLQSTTLKDVAEGASYLSIMTENLNVLREALK